MIGCQCRVQRGGGNLHQIRRFGPKQRGPDRQLGIKLCEYRPVQRKLADIAAGSLGRGFGRGVVGLVVHDQDLPFGDHQPVDLAGNQRRRLPGPVQPPDDRDLGLATRRKGVCKAWVRDQGDRAFRQRAPFVLGPAVGVAGEVRQRGLAAALGRDLGQRLQQPVHQRAALERFCAQQDRFA